MKSIANFKKCAGSLRSLLRKEDQLRGAAYACAFHGLRQSRDNANSATNARGITSMKKTIANNLRRRQVAIQLLRDAYKYTLARTPDEAWNSHRQFPVCVALEDAVTWPDNGRGLKIRESVCDELTSLISDRLGNCGYVHEWLMKHSAKANNHLSRELRKRGLADYARGYAQIPRLVEYRREWVRNMTYVLEQGGNL